MRQKQDQFTFAGLGLRYRCSGQQGQHETLRGEAATHEASIDSEVLALFETSSGSA